MLTVPRFLSLRRPHPSSDWNISASDIAARHHFPLHTSDVVAVAAVAVAVVAAGAVVAGVAVAAEVVGEHAVGVVAVAPVAVVFWTRRNASVAAT